ncbi:MAG: hypothetical protein ACI30I_04575 [Parabacteroides sp.]
MNKLPKQDSSRGLFAQLPERELPADFRTKVMERVMQVEARRQRRIYWGELIAIGMGVLFLLGLATVFFLYMDIQLPDLRMPKLRPDKVLFYGYLGFLSLCLLGADHLLRRYYQSRHTTSDKSTKN